MGSGYINMDKNKTLSLNSVVAIISKKGSEVKSEVILTKERYGSRTSSKKLYERTEGGKKTKQLSR